jgi:amino acid adenylation domain-containing protein
VNTAMGDSKEWSADGTPARSAAYPNDKGIHQLIEAEVRRTPQSIAAVFGAQSITYAELNSRANQLARHLLSTGVNQQAAVAVLMSRSVHCLIALLGAIKAGVAYVPIDLALPPKRAAYIMADSNVSHVLVDRDARTLLDQIGPIASGIVDVESPAIYSGDDNDLDLPFDPRKEVYCIYTSGSTGTPKGVMVPHQGLVNYVWWAKRKYVGDDIRNFALYSSLSFDLTITSIFIPLISGLCIHIFSESQDETPVIHRVVEDTRIDILKLTPSHLALLEGKDLSKSRLKVLILGGEDLKSEAAASIHDKLHGRAVIYNEYGPTEAVVGCMIYRYDRARDIRGSVPIGIPIDNTQIHLLDESLRPVKPGDIGEIHIGGDGVALGYKNKPEATAKAFIRSPFRAALTLYASGDLGKINADGQLEFLGRKDFQVKIRGYRIELGEVENVLLTYPGIKECIVTSTRHSRAHEEPDKVSFCSKCGMASNVPNTVFSANGVCSHCLAFEKYKDVLDAYFGTMDEFQSMTEQIKQERQPQYDCIVALSGGKDSTYVLCRMADLGMRVLAFTLDNGYISDKAKENIDRVVKRLNVDHRYLSTVHMKEIFVDSLRRHSNVCNGCFKTIYTMAINLAREVRVNYVVMGLSKGQLFETRMSELFRATTFNKEVFERNLIDARKIYHRIDDAVSRLLDTRNVKDAAIIESVQFIDFYRYCHVSQQDMYSYIEDRVGWTRPNDTGRSTNCLINDVGIYIHNSERRYHNYSLPYSWDVRMGHISREHAMRELDDSNDIDVDRVHAIMKEIGYTLEKNGGEAEDVHLVAHYVSPAEIPATELRKLMSESLPEYMLPTYFVHLDRLPLTANGKVNRQALPKPERLAAGGYVAPVTALERELAEMWESVLTVDRVGIHDNFFEIGGHSLTALMLLYKIDAHFQKTISIVDFSREPTISGLSRYLVDPARSNDHSQRLEQ